MVGSHLVEEKSFEFADLASLNLVKVALDTSVDDADLLLTVQWLLHELGLHIASA